MKESLVSGALVFKLGADKLRSALWLAKKYFVEETGRENYNGAQCRLLGEFKSECL